MKRYKESSISEFVGKLSKTTSSNASAKTATTTATAVTENEGQMSNAIDFTGSSMGPNTSVMNDENSPNDFGLCRICNRLQNCLTSKHLSQLLMICKEGPDPSTLTRKQLFEIVRVWYQQHLRQVQILNVSSL